MPPESGVCFDYALDPETLSPERKQVFDALAARVERAGEPFQTFFTPDDLEKLLCEAGFSRVVHADAEYMNRRYFNERADGLKLSTEALGQMAAAWV